MYLPVSGVEVAPWLPPLVAFLIASCTTSSGISGGVLLLPFQMSVLGFISPSVSPTNLIYNIVNQVCWADGGADKTQYAHLEGKQENPAGDPRRSCT